MEVTLIVLTAILAIAAVLSAVSARSSVKITQKSVRLQAITQLLNEYSTEEMRRHINAHKDAFEGERKEETLRIYNNVWKPEGDFKTLDQELEVARRSVAWYFTKIHILYKERALTIDNIKDLVGKSQVEILIDNGWPLEQPGRGTDVYDFFQSLYTKEDNMGVRKSEG